MTWLNNSKAKLCFVTEMFLNFRQNHNVTYHPLPQETVPVDVKLLVKPGKMAKTFAWQQLTQIATYVDISQSSR